MATLERVPDPEMPISIVELGLVEINQLPLRPNAIWKAIQAARPAAE